MDGVLRTLIREYQGQFSHCYIPLKLRILKTVSGSIFRNISGVFDLLSTIFQVLKITFYFPNGSFGSTPAKSAKTTNVSYELILNTQRILDLKIHISRFNFSPYKDSMLCLKSLGFSQPLYWTSKKRGSHAGTNKLRARKVFSV
jgi:hypothetical protein